MVTDKAILADNLAYAETECSYREHKEFLILAIVPPLSAGDVTCPPGRAGAARRRS
jgi:hypothetical protein